MNFRGQKSINHPLFSEKDLNFTPKKLIFAPKFYYLSFFAVCLDGWFMHDGTCYLIHGEELDFEAAKTTCEGVPNAKLFEPQNQEIFLYIHDIVMNVVNGEYYLGVTISDLDDPADST